MSKLYLDKTNLKVCEEDNATFVTRVMQLICPDGNIEIRTHVTSSLLTSLLKEQVLSAECSTDILTAVIRLNDAVLTFDQQTVKADDAGNDSLNMSYDDYEAETDESESDHVNVEKQRNTLRISDCTNDESYENVINYDHALQDELIPTSTKLKTKDLKSINCSRPSKRHKNVKKRYSHTDDLGKLDENIIDYPLQCAFCKLMYKKRFSLLDHVRTMHANYPENAKPYACSDCGRSFRLVHILVQHLYTHKTEDERPYKCSDHCDKRFSTKNQLLHHVQVYRNIRPYQCDQCEKAWSSAAALKDHLVSHSNEKPHLCDDCGESFRRKSQLTRHRFNRHAEKTHRCDQCGKAFPTLADVTRHSAIHDVNRVRYRCTLCEVSVTKPSHLNRHIRNVHRDIAPASSAGRTPVDSSGSVLSASLKNANAVQASSLESATVISSTDPGRVSIHATERVGVKHSTGDARILEMTGYSLANSWSPPPPQPATFTSQDATWSTRQHYINDIYSLTYPVDMTTSI